MTEPLLRSSAVEKHDGDGSVFAADQTDQVGPTVADNADVLVRDRLPAEWTIVKGDAYTTCTDDNMRFVEFTNGLEDGTRTYSAEAPSSLSDTQNYEFGSIEYSPDDEENWVETPVTVACSCYSKGNN